jgi:hypothetical protein
MRSIEPDGFLKIQQLIVMNYTALSLIVRHLSKEQQWENFEHELFHILRHAGN